MKPGFSQAFKVYQTASRQVPAYQKFLQQHGIKRTAVKNLSDFSSLPIIDKNNYLRRYPLNELVAGGNIPTMLSASSGSSGEPFYWPWAEEQIIRGSDIHHRIFNKIFRINGKRTLVIVCFSMGTWIAGTYTTACCQHLSRRYRNISIVTPGIEQEDVLAILKKLAPNFKKVILAGYPPLVMDIISVARRRRINLDKLNISLLLAGEGFSERWRGHLHELAGIKDDFAGSVNIYGTADAAILGFETPLTVYLRRQADKDKNLSHLLWGEHNFMPTLVQYEPRYKYFEIVQGEIVLTSQSGIPLVRYNIHDRGIIYTVAELKNKLAANGYGNLISAKYWDDWRLPLLVLGSRDDVALTFYAVNIYPQNIMLGLERDEVKKFVTGKFLTKRMTIKKGREQIFSIKVELAEGIRAGEALRKRIAKSIFSVLLRDNSEFRRLYNALGEKAKPQLELFSYNSKIFQLQGAKLKRVTN